MSRAHIITAIIGDGLSKDTAFRPDLPEFSTFSLQNPAIGYDELLQIPPDPAMAVVEVIATSQEITDFDAANPGDVIWRNPIPGPSEQPSPARRGQMVISLRDKGVAANDAAQLVNGNPNSTAGEVGNNVADYASEHSGRGNRGNSGK